MMNCDGNLALAIRATPPVARMSAGTRSSAMTAHAPASSAIRAFCDTASEIKAIKVLHYSRVYGIRTCSALTTSMMTPPYARVKTRNYSDRCATRPRCVRTLSIWASPDLTYSHRRMYFSQPRQLGFFWPGCNTPQMCLGCCFLHPLRVLAHKPLSIQRGLLPLLGELESAAAARHSSLGSSSKNETTIYLR